MWSLDMSSKVCTLRLTLTTEARKDTKLQQKMHSDLKSRVKKYASDITI